MGKKFDESLKYLGSDHSSKVIDLENVIYRQIGGFEVEVSGLNTPGKYNATIYLWKDRKLVCSITDIYSKEDLSKRLETVVSEHLHIRD